MDTERTRKDINKMIYTGVFFNKIFVGEGKLEKQIAFPHVTHQFKPSEVNPVLFGQSVIFKVIGYGIDKDNEGYLVEVFSATEEMKKALGAVDRLHITVSTSAEGKAVNTKNLDFKPCGPWYIGGVYGGFEKNSTFFHFPY